MPSKLAKYKIKSWVACDAKSSYAWQMQVYTGKPSGGHPEWNQGLRVVLDVTEGLHSNITCENYFTSYELARQHPGEENHRGRHGSEEQARAPACGSGKRGVLIQVCIHAHRQHPKEKQEHGAPEHAARETGHRPGTTTAAEVAWTT